MTSIEKHTRILSWFYMKCYFICILTCYALNYRLSTLTTIFFSIWQWELSVIYVCVFNVYKSVCCSNFQNQVCSYFMLIPKLNFLCAWWQEVTWQGKELWFLKCTSTSAYLIYLFTLFNPLFQKISPHIWIVTRQTGGWRTSIDKHF